MKISELREKSEIEAWQQVDSLLTYSSNLVQAGLCSKADLDQSQSEIDRMLVELRNRVRDLRFKVASRQLNDVREIREARQAIAQVLTLKRSRRKA